MTRTLLAAALLILLLLASCGPATFSLTLGQRDTRLTETTVLQSDSPGNAKVALIEVRGLIVDAATPGLLSQGQNPVDQLVAQLDKAAKDNAVRAVVLRIDSPGGGVTASDVMYRELLRFRERTNKPIIASLATVAASGGYYIALAADEIITEPTSITGSIGVIFPTFNVSDAMARWGITSRAVVSQPNKNLASPFEPMQESHYAILQTLVDEDYARFRQLVVQRRPALSPADLQAATDGRIFTGRQAVALALADAEGGIREAFDHALARANLSTGRLVRYHQPSQRPRTPYAVVTANPAAPSSATTDPTTLRLELPGSSYLALEPAAYYLWLP